ncbi:M4 family metallopeptidase [Paenibacillus larvae]|nr:M4 family metallopeptidase [Paenibacillus larvae]MDT2261974.1 M4 family metallopeptidase [Paenibacillus larvae]
MDGEGMQIKSTVHLGLNYNNAFWNGEQIAFYGDGDGVNFRAFSSDLGVTGHELTHGVTQYTANLEYRNEPGALNESISDIGGNSIKTKMVNRRRCVGKKEKLNDKTQHVMINRILYEDSGQVHFDNGGESISTVELITKPSICSQKEELRGVTVSGIGRDEAVEKSLYYHALTHYLTIHMLINYEGCSYTSSKKIYLEIIQMRLNQ